MSDHELLARAVAAHGIEPGYTDVFGRKHETSDEVARAMLASLGFPAETEDEITRGLESESATEWARGLDETLVIHEDADSLRVRIPAARQGMSVKLEIQWENGEVEHHWHFLPSLATVESAHVGGVSYVAKRFPLPKPLRPGYHHARVYWMTEPELEVFAEACFIVCPKRVRTPEKRMAGLGLSLYGLRSSRNWGFGDFSDLYPLIDAFAPAGAAFLALNPLHAIANRSPYNTSPYLPQCAFYRNFLYLDVEKCGEIHLDDALRREIEALRAAEFVEYERAAKVKLDALARVFDAFKESGGSREFTDYGVAHGRLLDDYAIYCALDEEMHRRDANVWLWTEWPEEYRDPRSEAVRIFAEQHRARVQFFKFLQWNLSKQAAEVQAYARAKGMPIGLYHDLALATDRFGADLWALRPFFVESCRVGAPPDELAPQGQDWAFPPPDREAHRRNGYKLFAQSIRNAAEAGGALRIDHVMRFVRLFWIPEKFSAKDGAYVRDNAHDLLGVLALESARANFVVVGEDLGTVTGEVRQLMSEAGVLSYRLPWFERDGSGRFLRPEEYPAQALAAASTHDLPTLAGFALGRDIEARKSAGLVDQSEYERQKAARRDEVARLNQAFADAGFANDALGFLLSTPCHLAVINQEDLTGETEQQNLPGSTWQYPNWKRKMRVKVEDLAPLAERFASLVKRSGR